MSRNTQLGLALLVGIGVGLVLALALELGSRPAPGTPPSLAVSPAGAAPPVGAPQGRQAERAAAGRTPNGRTPQAPEPGAEWGLAELDRSDWAQVRAIAEAAASEPARSDAAASGFVTGVVVDHLGAPIEGAVVRAWLPSNQRRAPAPAPSARRSWEPPPDLTATLEAYAATTLRRRGEECLGTTDAEGRFRLGGVGPGRYSVKAYHAGSAFRRQADVRAGASLYLAGREVFAFQLNVVRSDGVAVEEALIGLGGEDGHPNEYLPWSVAQPVVELARDAEWFTVYLGAAAATRSGVPFSSFRSEPRWIHAGILGGEHGGGVHTLMAAPVPALIVRVRDPEEGVRPTPAVAYARVESVRQAGGEEAFWKVDRRVMRWQDGVYRTPRMAPGDYLLGVGRGGEPIVLKPFTVGDGVTELDVTLPPMDSDRYAQVTVSGARGEPLSGAQLTLVSKVGERFKGRQLPATEREPGVYWIPLPIRRPNGTESQSMAVNVPPLGVVQKPMAFGQRSLAVAFAKPAVVTVKVAADPAQMYQVTIRQLDEYALPAIRPLNRISPGFTNSRGEARFRGLQPGPALIGVRRAGDRSRLKLGMEVAEVSTTLWSGEVDVTVKLPALFELEVYAPGEEPGDYLHLHRSTGKPYGLDGGQDILALGDDHRVTFTDLEAGDYWVTVEGESVPVAVTVPSGALVLERPDIFGYRVRVTRPDKARGPWEEGDVLVEVDGESVAVGDVSDRISLALSKGPARVKVLRQGTEQVLEVPEWLSHVRFEPVAAPLGR